MNKQILPWLITFCAIGLGGTAGYYSVIGLSKLFAGEATAVIIMASFLEISKLVLATLLHAYWDNLNKLLKTYYISALVILSIITSAGIYGMLSSGYQKTSSELTIVENQKEFLAQKIDFYQKDLNIYNTELERISNNISTLSNAKSITTQVRDNNATGGIRSVVSTTELKLAQQRISVEEKNRNDVQSKRQIVADSLQNLQLQLLELDNNSETAGELGPLKYLANLTGISMGRIINWILLVIIFVFDPLAISLVIAANFAFSQSQSKISPKLEEQVENMREVVEIENYITPENVPDIKLDMDNNGILDVKEINSAYLKMQELETQIQNPNISSWKRTRLQNQINQIKAQLEEEDTTKIY